MAITFPRPGYTMPDDHPYLLASQDAAERLWRALESGQKHEVVLAPDMLYARGGGGFSLQCWQQAPILQRVGIFLANRQQGHELNDGQVSVSAGVASTMTFPMADSLKTFGREGAEQLEACLWPVAVDSPTQSVAAFHRLMGEKSTISGLTSPFSVFDLDFSVFQRGFARRLLEGTSHLTLIMMMDVLPLPSNQSVQGVATCREER